MLQLQAIRDARAAGALHAAREAMGQLLGPYWEWARFEELRELRGTVVGTERARTEGEDHEERIEETLGKDAPRRTRGRTPAIPL